MRNFSRAQVRKIIAKPSIWIEIDSEERLDVTARWKALDMAERIVLTLNK
jgi:hypothetical protein